MRGNGTIRIAALAVLLLAGLSVAHGADRPSDMVSIPAGLFLMGADGRDGKIGFEIGVDSSPRHQRQVAGFKIDRTEVTNGAYREFVRATGHRAPADPRFPEYFKWEEGNFPPGLERHPVVYVDWFDARDYCQWAGKRLPSEAEWEKAARGTDGRPYPWGEDFDPQYCNTQEGRLGWTAPVGGYEGDVSPYGVHDMCGNVTEWTADWYQAYPGSTLERQSFGEHFRMARGSNWMLAARPYARLSNRTLAFEPKKQHRGLGFRCAVSAEGEGP